jgi:DNA gyrase/topoisomerase IV subunit B
MDHAGIRQFDLNIERVQEQWTVPHALREVIANALDEQVLTGTAEPAISKDADGVWHVRDYGRSIRYEHLTQNENKEKLRRATTSSANLGRSQRRTSDV